MTDPIVEEVRRLRMEHTLKCNSDLSLICQDMLRVQEQCGHKIVRLEPKRPDSKHDSSSASK